jgi:hypothetical protein
MIEGTRFRPANFEDTMMRILGISLAAVLIASNAYAYVDPASGSFLIQVLLAGALGILASFRHPWRRLRVWMRKLVGKGEDGG